MYRLLTQLSCIQCAETGDNILRVSIVILNHKVTEAKAPVSKEKFVFDLYGYFCSGVYMIWKDFDTHSQVGLLDPEYNTTAKGLNG